MVTLELRSLSTIESKFTIAENLSDCPLHSVRAILQIPFLNQIHCFNSKFGGNWSLKHIFIEFCSLKAAI